MDYIYIYIYILYQLKNEKIISDFEDEQNALNLRLSI